MSQLLAYKYNKIQNLIIYVPHDFALLSYSMEVKEWSNQYNQ